MLAWRVTIFALCTRECHATDFLLLKVPKVFVFFTDGTNSGYDDDLIKYAEDLKKKGVTTLAIGVGSDTDEDELTTIASGSKKNVFRIDEFEELKLVIQELITALCPR